MLVLFYNEFILEPEIDKEFMSSLTAPAAPLTYLPRAAINGLLEDAAAAVFVMSTL